MDLIFGVFFYNLSSKVVYIRNRSLQPCSLEYELASHTTYITREWRELYFKVFFEFQIFEKLFMEIFIHSVCQKSAERKSAKKYFIILRFARNV